MKRILVALGMVLVACGPIEDFPDGEEVDGRVCYSDADCVPDDCCGQGSGAIHVADAPDCRGVVCDGMCPTDMIDCGCAIPVCRNSRCQPAYRDTCL